MVESLWPVVTGKRCVVTRASCDKTSHAVADDRQLIDRVWPIAQELFHYVSKFAAVGGDMPAAVVVEVDRGVAALAPQELAVRSVRVVPVGLREPPPRVVGLAEAVHEHCDP